MFTDAFSHLDFRGHSSHAFTCLSLFEIGIESCEIDSRESNAEQCFIILLNACNNTKSYMARVR